MPYDVFISYASSDRVWADRLRASLEARGVSVFQDTRALRVAEGWEEQLDSALFDCRHLVCLWSAAAKESGWVTREVADYRAELRRRKTGAGLLMIVQLDPTKHTYSSLQQLGDSALHQAYAAGIDTLDTDLWTNIVTRLDQRIKLGQDAVVVPLVPLTLTAAQLADIPQNRLLNIATDLGLDPASLPQRYGATRLDWQPFGDGRRLETLLQDVKADLDHRLAPRVAHWLLPEDDFWNDADDGPALAFISAMKAQRLGVIVIDPIALLHTDVQAQLGRFTACLGEEGIAVIAPPPFPASKPAANFRRHLRMRAAAMLKDHFDPPLDAEGALRMRFGIGADDKDELLRLVRQGLGVQARRRGGAVRPAASALDNDSDRP